MGPLSSILKIPCKTESLSPKFQIDLCYTDRMEQFVIVQRSGPVIGPFDSIRAAAEYLDKIVWLTQPGALNKPEVKALKEPRHA